jgi:ATP-dependent helicase/nuclease subunit B
LLGDGVRRALDLEHWRGRAGRDAELFLRLLHGAPQVRLSWPAERDGQPALPSPLIQRLTLLAPLAEEQSAEPVLYRRTVPALDDLAAPERRFRAEPEPIPGSAAPPPRKLSHTSLQRHRDCPYRFLLADAFGLRRADPVEAEFSAADHGNLAHGVMQAWLSPGGAGVAALAGGDRHTARATLEQAAHAAFDARGRDLPGAAVALRSLLALGPDLVELELQRHRTWRPAALEAPFHLTVGAAADWLADHGGSPPALAAGARDVELHGYIDRVDLTLDGAAAAVLDYKTGSPPARRRVADGRELQVHLYGLAVATGALDGLGGPRPVREGAYYGLRSGSLGPPRQKPHLAGEAELVAGVESILATAAAILDPDEPFALVPDWRDDGTTGRLPCHTCEFRGVCRLEERATTPALAARVTALLTENRGGRS